ncbi:type IV secretion system protein [Xanthomonas albilineans]|uniref:type IV secretion system protein n=1 Tax=Xanthomonas albilineans TaxID=29447 RepID=UPI0005F35AA8|nr:type IV secretion system protein [Xanthomonas albilineans]
MAAAMTLKDMIASAEGVTTNFLAQTYPAIASAVTPTISALAILYWALYGYKVYAGHAGLQWKEFLGKAAMTSFIFAALNWGGLASQIYGWYIGMMDGASATIMAGQPTDSMLDALYNNVGKVASMLQKADFYQIGIIIEGSGLFFLNCLLFVVAFVYMTIAKIGLSICMVLMPIFLGFFMFEQSRQWAINWISKMLNFTFIYILVIAIIRFGFVAFAHAIEEVKQAANVADAALITSQQIGMISIIEAVLIIFMLQVKGWAAQLSGGVTVQGMSALLMLLRPFIRR